MGESSVWNTMWGEEERDKDDCEQGKPHCAMFCKWGCAVWCVEFGDCGEWG